MFDFYLGLPHTRMLKAPACDIIASHNYATKKCDPLTENPAHPAFYENRDKTRNRYIDV